MILSPPRQQMKTQGQILLNFPVPVQLYQHRILQYGSSHGVIVPFLQGFTAVAPALENWPLVFNPAW